MTAAKQSRLLSIKSAAAEAGFSVRHFMRIYYEDYNGRIVEINRKFFVMRKDLNLFMDRRRKAS